MLDNMQFAGGTDQQPQGGDVSAVADANNAQDRPLTRAEIEKMVDDRAAKQFQALQSMQSKQEARLKKEVENRLAALQATGIQLTPEQANKVFVETEKQFRQEADDKSQVAQPGYQGQTPSNQPPRNPIEQAAYEMMVEENVFINQDDPEFAMVNTQTTSGRLFLSSIDKAIEAKKERLARPRGMPAASPSLAAAGGNANSNALEAQYQAEVSKIRRGDTNALNALKKRYREKGLRI